MWEVLSPIAKNTDIEIELNNLIHVFIGEVLYLEFYVFYNDIERESFDQIKYTELFDYASVWSTQTVLHN